MIQLFVRFLESRKLFTHSGGVSTCSEPLRQADHGHVSLSHHGWSPEAHEREKVDRILRTFFAASSHMGGFVESGVDDWGSANDIPSGSL